MPFNFNKFSNREQILIFGLIILIVGPIMSFINQMAKQTGLSEVFSTQPMKWLINHTSTYGHICKKQVIKTFITYLLHWTYLQACKQ